MLQLFLIRIFSHFLYGVIGVITFLPCNKAYLVVIIIIITALGQRCSMSSFLLYNPFIKMKEQLIFDLIISG